MSFRTGLLIGASPKNIGNILKQTFQNDALSTLYIKLLPEMKIETSHQLRISNSRINPEVFKKTVFDYYNKFQNDEIDVRVILTNLKDPDNSKLVTSKPVEIVYFDSSCSSAAVEAFMDKYVTNKSQNYRSVSFQAINDESNFTFSEIAGSDDFSCYNNVVLGGTFDKLHIGHKILLSEAILRCRKRLTVGVTCDSLLQCM